MWNLIKAQNYQIKKDNAIIYIYLVGFICIMFSLMEYISENTIQKLTGGECGIILGEVNFIVIGLLTILLTARIMGWDYTDKTLNYEILAGHKRRKIFLSRVCVCVLWCMISCGVFMVVPPLIFTGINGWGTYVDMGGMLRQYAMMLFPIFRLMSECILLTVISKNCYMVMIIGFFAYELCWWCMAVIESVTDFHFTIQLATTNIYKLIHLEYSNSDFVDGIDVFYEVYIKPELVSGTITVSLIVGILCLLLGYWYFKKSDMN